jgi:hypothetical protein
MRNQVTIGQKIIVGFAIPMSFIVLNAWMSIFALENQQNFSAQVIEEIARNPESDSGRSIDDLNQRVQESKKKITVFAIFGIVITIMVGFLIARSIRPPFVAGDGDEMDRKIR